MSRSGLRPVVALTIAACATLVASASPRADRAEAPARTAAAASPDVAPDTVPSPESFFGFPMGAERRLASWSRITDYLRAVDRASDRIEVREVGKTTLGKPYLLVIASDERTIASIEQHRLEHLRFADPRGMPDAEAERVAREGKAVALVGMNVHATEIGSSQMANELVYRLATDDSPAMRHVREHAIVLIVPSQNPDGLQMVVDWYERNRGTPYEDSPLPELYHPYAGHDNNRDAYMLTQVESQHLARLLYREWLPEVYLDKHQMGSSRARIFVPPFRNPPNPNIDPLIWSEVNLLGQAMAARLDAAGKPGVMWGEQYTGYWQGANSTNPWWHNMVALLTETASARLAAPIYQEMARLPGQQLPPATSAGMSGGLLDRPPDTPLPAPTDTQFRMNYPNPWLGGRWTLADIVEYQMLSTLGLLEAVASNHELLKRNFRLMNRRTIERFSTGSPRAFLVRRDQPDPGAAARLVSLLQDGGAEVHEAARGFAAAGRSWPAGTIVVPLAQPFGRWIKDLLEPQEYPDIRWPFATGPIERPYDVTAWTLGMLMGVETVAVDEPIEVPLVALKDRVQAPPGTVLGRGRTFLLDPRPNATYRAVNRLWEHGATIRRARAAVPVDGATLPAGTFIVTGVRREAMESLAAELRVTVHAVRNRPDVDNDRLKRPRIALYEPWGGSMDAGWTRFVLEQHGFEYTHARNADLRGRTPLRDRFDVIVLPELSSAQILRGLQASHVRPEHRGGLGAEGVRNLRAFLEDGGTLVVLGNSAQFAIESFQLPFRNVIAGVDDEEFYAPGTLLRVQLEPDHPLSFGLPPEVDAMFVDNGGYVLTGATPSSTGGRIVGAYPRSALRRSGWMIGEARLQGLGAVLEAPVGRGRAVLLTFRVQNRAQTWGTFKLLFNALLRGAA